MVLAECLRLHLDIYIYIIFIWKIKKNIIINMENIHKYFFMFMFYRYVDVIILSFDVIILSYCVYILLEDFSFIGHNRSSGQPVCSHRGNEKSSW